MERKSNPKRTKRDVERYARKLYRAERIEWAVDWALLAAAGLAVVLAWTGAWSGSGVRSLVTAGAIAESGKFGWSFWKRRRANQALFGAAVGTLETATEITAASVKLTALKPHPVDSGLGFVRRVYGGELALSSADLNYALRADDFVLVHNPHKRDRVRESIRRRKQDLIPVLRRIAADSIRDDRAFFNDPKLALASNFSVARRQAFYHEGSYFDGYLTNELCARFVRESGETTLDFRDQFPVAEQHGDVVVRSLERSGLEDYVGISTIGRTLDGYLVFWEQGKRAQQSVGKRAPTASGSCDLSDLHGTSLHKTIAYAMQRELVEETTLKARGVSPVAVGQTRIIGFFRWVSRGGKPEFIGITRLNHESSELWPDPAELNDDARKHFIEPCADVKQLRDLLAAAPSWPNCSLPVLHMVEVLAELLDSPVERSFVTDLWFGNAEGVAF